MSGSRKPTAAQARERRARIAAVVLGAVFLLVCAIQAPRVLKHTHGSPVAAAPVVSPPASHTALASAVTVHTTHLARLGRFAWKDPFRQQLQPSKSPQPAAPSAAPPAAEKPKAEPPAPAKVPASVPPAQSRSFTPLPAKPVVTGRQGVLLLLDGKRLGLLRGDLFPTADPVFELVSFRKTSARVALLAGTLSGGGATLKLRVGHRLVLRNATTGQVYDLELVRLARIVPPAPRA